MQAFQREIIDVLHRRQFTIDDVDYINLDNTYTIEPNYFFELNEFPKNVENKFLKVSWCNAWDVPTDFRIVLKDGTVILYNTTSDEYYSGWICVRLPKRSPIAITK